MLEDNIRISANAANDIVVVAGYGTSYKLVILNGGAGIIVTGPTTITCGVDVKIRQLIGISDSTMVFVGYDNATDDSMLVTRVSSAGVLDETFNAQGPLPGTLSIKIGDQISNYFSRVGSGVTVQSHIGINQGNLILTGYEQMFANDAMPLVMRIFGAPGTTQVKNFVVPVRIPGTFDPTYDQDGIAENYVLGASSPIANQEVRAVRQLTGTQIMTIVTDQTTSISYTERLNADSTIDTTYGGGLGIPIAKLNGTELVQTMVFDSAGNFLVTGSNSNYGGFVKRILPDGSMDQLFGGKNGHPLGTVYGLMDVVNACQELTNGNIVYVGSVNGVGTIQAINSLGAPILNFGINGSTSLGINMTSISVDPLNNMYVSVAYNDGIILKAGILKVNILGQRDNGFGVNGFVENALSTIDNADSLRLAFDDALRMCIAGSAGNINGRISINRFSSTGSIDLDFNNGMELVVSEFPFVGNVVVTSLVTLENNKILVSGYQSGTTMNDNCEFVACVTSAGQLDETFGRQTPLGLVTFQALPTPQIERKLANMNVQTDGNILLSGGEVPQTNYETPLTMRLFGYLGVQPVPQFTGYQASLPNVLNPSFNGNGIAETPSIPNLDEFGSVVTDAVGRVSVGSVTSDGFFKIARFLRNGLADTIENGGVGFGTNGIASTTVPMAGLSGGYVAVDIANRIYIGGIVNSALVVARFTTVGILDETYGIHGIASSANVLFDIAGGGFITIDRLQKCLISGFTTGGNLVVTRFEINGATDTSFSTNISNYIAYVSVPSMISGRGVTTDDINDVYLGARTSNTMLAVKLDNTGVINTSYGDNGFAVSDVIDGLVDGGTIASNSRNQIFLGGLNLNQQFIVVRFRVTGDLDPIFNGNGMALSSPVNILNELGTITVDNNDRPIIGGIASGYKVERSAIVARFNIIGNLDTTFSSTGIASTGPITGLLSGGAVAVDIFDCIFVSGITVYNNLIVAQMYSGEEIFTTNPLLLNAQDVMSLYYGNNRLYLEKVLSIKHLARVITNPVVSLAVRISVNTLIRSFDLLYATEPGRNNLVWNFYATRKDREALKLVLLGLYSGSAAQIEDFFLELEARALGIRYTSY